MAVLAVRVKLLVTSVVKAALLNIFNVVPEAQAVAILAATVPVSHLAASETTGAATTGQEQSVLVNVTTRSIVQPAALKIRTV